MQVIVDFSPIIPNEKLPKGASKKQKPPFVVMSILLVKFNAAS